MPTFVQCDDLPVTPAEVEMLWQETCTLHNYPDANVAIRCVSPTEIQQLNKQYRGTNAATNVLTFSYGTADAWPTIPDENNAASATHHDVALCLPVAEAEAAARSASLRDYVALLLVHGFLHIVGLDHERSGAEEQTTRTHEATILSAGGFQSTAL